MDAIGFDSDVDGAIGAFVEVGAISFMVVVGLICISKVHVASA